MKDKAKKDKTRRDRKREQQRKTTRIGRIENAIGKRLLIFNISISVEERDKKRNVPRDNLVNFSHTMGKLGTSSNTHTERQSHGTSSFRKMKIEAMED